MEKIEVMARIANEFIKGMSSTIVVNKSADSSMNKGRGAKRNPFLGRVRIEKTYHGYVMGTDYVKSVVATVNRMVDENNQIQISDVKVKPNWHKPCAAFGEWFSTDKRTETKVYLKIQRNQKQVAHKTTTTYFLDNRLATNAEVAEIKKWVSKKDKEQSSTQVELGLDKQHEQHFLLMQLDTIESIKQGERRIEPHKLLTEVHELAMAAR